MIKNVILDYGNVLIDWNPAYLFLPHFNGDEKKCRFPSEFPPCLRVPPDCREFATEGFSTEYTAEFASKWVLAPQSSGISRFSSGSGKSGNNPGCYCLAVTGTGGSVPFLWQFVRP